MANEPGGARLGRLFQAMVDQSDLIKLLRDDPERLAKQFDLGEKDLEALRSADGLVIALMRRDITFETGSTFTARMRREITFETGTTITAGRARNITFETGTTITARR